MSDAERQPERRRPRHASDRHGERHAGADGPSDGDGTGDDAGARPPPASAGDFGPRPMLGMPAEQSEDFGDSTRRLLGAHAPRAPRLRRRASLLAVASVTLTVLRPEDPRPRHRHHRRRRHRRPSGIDFAALHRTLLRRPRPLRRVGRRWPTCRPTSSPASCSARCTGCAPTSRTSSTACRSATSTASPAATCSAGSPTTSTTSPRACSRR